jgi:hypothetical protein
LHHDLKLIRMKNRTDFFFKTLQVVSWIIFIGVCVEAGGFIFNTIFTLWLTPAGASKFWTEVDLSNLYDYNQTYYVVITATMIIVAVLRAIMFYLIIKLFYDKKFNLAHPFNLDVKKFIQNIAYLALAIGLFSYSGALHTKELVNHGVNMPALQYLRLAGADVWLFMGVILLVIAQIFKRGIEIQTENDLTV